MTAKFNLLVVTAIPAIAIVPLLACGGGSDKTVDAATNGSGSGSGSGSGFGSGSGSNTVCLLPTNLGTISSFSAQLVQYRSGLGSGSATRRANSLTFAAALDANDTQEIQVTIFDGCGSSGSNCSGRVSVTPDWPTTFGPKSGLDVAHVIDARVAAAGGIGSNAQTSALYRLTAGTLDVADARDGSGSAGSGALFMGTLSNATLVHVDIGSAGVMPDPDGCTTTITSMTFSGTSFTGKTLVLEDVDADDLGVTYLRHRFTQQ